MFDPRNNAPRIGRILIAQGRDAADVPLTHTFGPGILSGFRVWADEVPLGIKPLASDEPSSRLIPPLSSNGR